MLKVFIKRLLILFFFFPFLSYAETYNWGIVGDYSMRWSSPSHFAADYADFNIKPQSHVNCEIRLTKINSERYNWARYCNRVDSQGNVLPDFTKNGDGAIMLYGDSCPVDQVYNPETGGCEPDEPDECEDLDSIRTWAPATKQYNGFWATNEPPSVCLNSCQYLSGIDFGHSGCVVGGSTGYRCAVTYMPTGSSCTTGDGNDGSGDGGGDGPDSDLPPEITPDTDDDEEPDTDCRKFVNLDGSWGYDCSPKPDPDENNQCPAGYMAQGDTCFRIPPDHPDYDPSKDPGAGDGGDGDSDGKGGDDKEDGDYAKDSTVKDVDKTLKGIDGSIKSGNSQTAGLLQGVIDAINNKPVGGGGGGGNGDGDGDGDGEEDGEGEVSGGDTCDNPPVCTGDAIQCEIIKQQFTMRCDFEEAYDFEAHEQDIASAVEGDEFSLYESETPIEVSSFITGNARWLSGSCPQPEQINLRLNGGRAFNLSYEPLCQAADFISPLIVIIATVMATLYVGRSAGG